MTAGETEKAEDSCLRVVVRGFWMAGLGLRGVGYRV